MLSEKQIENLKNWRNKKLKKFHLDEQIGDIHSEIDRSLTIEENKDIILGKIKKLLNETDKDVGKAEELEKKSQEEVERLEIIQEIENKEVQKLKDMPSSDALDKIYEPITEAVEMQLNENTAIEHICIFGPTGTGKTINTEKIYAKHNEKFKNISGDSSKIGLCNTLRDNRNDINKFDDENLWKNPEMMNILKSVMTTGIVKLNSAHYLVDDELKQGFEFKGKITIIVNEIPRNNPHFDALKSRLHLVPFYLNQDKMIILMREFAKNPLKEVHRKNLNESERLEVVDFIEKEIAEFDLRTFELALDFRIHFGSNWREIAKKRLNLKKEEL